MRNILLFDFDGTIADTFSESPNGVNVHSASEYGVVKTLGVIGADIYHEQGGLKNREPREMVVDILNEALRHGIHLRSGESVADLSKEFVGHKLSQYEITNQWPRMYPGARELFRAAAEGVLPVDVGIVSSGHEQFIADTFKVNEVPLPEVVVTSDDIRDLENPKRILSKPHTYMLAMAHRKFLQESDHKYHGDYLTQDEMRPAFKAHIAYVGDDPVKDGGLAHNTRIPYFYVPFTKPGFTPDEGKGQFGINNYQDFLEQLMEKREDLAAGKSWAEVLTGRPDCELFPPLIESERPYAEWMRAGAKEKF